MTSNLLNIPDEVLKASKTIKPHLSFIKATLSEQVTMETRIRSVTPVESNESNLSIVFLHGASFSSKNWDEDLNTLSIFGALGYPTFALDLPGIKIIFLHSFIVTNDLFKHFKNIIFTRIWRN